MKRRLGSTVVVVLIALAATSSGGATATGKLCSRFTHGRITYQSQTVGTSRSCATGGMCIKATPAFPRSGFAWFPV